jgi:cob(I)alamin adenosyltransferase
MISLYLGRNIIRQKGLIPHQYDYNFHMTPNHTHTGDNGSAGLLGRGALPKYHPRMEALGVLDEASAALGLARALCNDTSTGNRLEEVQRDLYAVMAEVAATPENAHKFRSLGPERVLWLESQTDAIAASTPLPEDFILPGDSLPGAALALARTIVRRAERRIVELFDSSEITNKVLLQYLNRLSSLCFAMEVFENAQAGKPATLAKQK